MKLTALHSTVALFMALLPVGLHAQSTERMSFSLADDQSTRMAQVLVAGKLSIYAEGPIVEGDTERFLAFVRSRNVEAADVVLNSPGGSLVEGVKLGRAIRGLAFDTSIGSISRGSEGEGEGICASACAYAFAGGVLRYLSADRALLGLHQFASAGGTGLSEGNAQFVSGMLVAYLTEMGVDANAFAVASSSEPDGMVWLDADDAELLGFVNNGVLPTQAEIQMVDMRPYLWIGQSKPGVDLRAILICGNHAILMQAALVTDAEQSANWADPEWVKRSYLEFDDHEALVRDSSSGAKAEGNSLWLLRELSQQDTRMLLSANDLGIWLDGFGAIRVGGHLDLRPVRSKIRDYVSQCRGQ